MAYKQKPELEEGNYIAYTNEPDTVIDSAGSGGGEGGGGDIAIRSFKLVGGTATGMDFSYNDLLNAPFTFLKATSDAEIGKVYFYLPYYITSSGVETTYEAYFSDGMGTSLPFFADTANEIMRAVAS